MLLSCTRENLPTITPVKNSNMDPRVGVITAGQHLLELSARSDFGAADRSTLQVISESLTPWQCFLTSAGFLSAFLVCHRCSSFSFPFR